MQRSTSGPGAGTRPRGGEPAAGGPGDGQSGQQRRGRGAGRSAPDGDGEEQADGGGREPGRPRRGPGRQRLRDRTWARVTLALFATFMVMVSWSVGHALTAPGGGSASERLAEWARDHYLGPVVTLGEWLTYQPPKAGGRPAFALTGPSAGPVIRAGSAPHRGVRTRPLACPLRQRRSGPSRARRCPARAAGGCSRRCTASRRFTALTCGPAPSTPRMWPASP